MQINEIIPQIVVQPGQVVCSQIHGPGKVVGFQWRKINGYVKPTEVSVVFDNETEYVIPYYGHEPVKIHRNYSQSDILLGLF